MYFFSSLKKISNTKTLRSVTIGKSVLAIKDILGDLFSIKKKSIKKVYIIVKTIQLDRKIRKIVSRFFCMKEKKIIVTIKETENAR